MGKELNELAQDTEADPEMLAHLDLLLEYDAVKDEEQLAIAEELPEESYEAAPEADEILEKAPDQPSGQEDAK
jgi:hypothetical protein